MYGCPCNSEHVLKIVPSTGEISLVGGPYPGKQKWDGALLGGDGCMYCAPDASTLLAPWLGQPLRLSVSLGSWRG